MEITGNLIFPLNKNDSSHRVAGNQCRCPFEQLHCLFMGIVKRDGTSTDIPEENHTVGFQQD